MERRFKTLNVLATLGLAVLRSVSAQPIDPAELQGPATDAPSTAALDATDAKIHAQLRAALSARSRGLSASASRLPALLVSDTDVVAEVRFRADESATTAVAVLARHAAAVRHALSDALYETVLPIDRVRELAAEADVVYVQPARMARPLIGNQTSEGVAAGNATLWQSFNPSYTGTGITIAMIDSYNAATLAALQSSNDWPPAARLTKLDFKTYPTSPTICATQGFGCTANPHGDATMEIAYDVAYGATFRAYDTYTVGDWRSAILDAANVDGNGTSLGAVKANVISASLAAPNDGKGDGSALSGSIAEAAGFAKNRGVLVVNAAGNERENHWGGAYAAATSGAGFHTWSGTNTIYNPFVSSTSSQPACIKDGATITAELYWNDWSSPTHDYNLYIYENNGTAAAPHWINVAFSQNLQNGGSDQTPQELIQYVADSGLAAGCASYAVAVVKVSSTVNDNLQVFASTTENEPLLYQVHARSLTFPADSPNVISVAAIDEASKTTTPQEPFSSEGPVLATGGGLPLGNPSTDTNLKPDLASFDDVTTVTTGASKFFGTSASTPHVAGMAALFMQKFGVQTSSTNLTNAIITPLRTIAATGSNDLGTAGKDYQYGYGRLRFQQDAMLAFLQQPSNAAANAIITPAVKVQVIDKEGNADPYTLYTDVSLALGSNPGNATLTGGGSMPLTSGVATFSALSVSQGGTGYTLAAASTPAGLAGTSNAFNITTGTASKLVFTVQPSNTAAGNAVTPTVQVSIEDSTGAVVTSGSHSITLTKVGCTTTTPNGGGPIATVNGIASFPALTLNTAGTNITLQATSSGLTSATSSAFNVTQNSDIIFCSGFETCVP